ncbi:MAG: hypothetical protein RBR02_09495 [Desulfuromonadaceae bacterium]|nr:hypothetical protein [Desulfuromonadaceae bacterium]
MNKKLSEMSTAYGKNTSETIEFCIMAMHIQMTDAGVIAPVYNKDVESDLAVNGVKRLTEKMLKNKSTN